MKASTRGFVSDISSDMNVAFPPAMTDLISGLSESGLAALEDELDFYAFTGVPSQRMLGILDRADLLDEAWRMLLAQDQRAVVPTILKFKPMATHRRAQSRRLPFQALPGLPETA